MMRYSTRDLQLNIKNTIQETLRCAAAAAAVVVVVIVVVVAAAVCYCCFTIFFAFVRLVLLMHNNQCV